jgi:hypothetical protein
MAEAMFALSSLFMGRQLFWPSFGTADGPIGFNQLSARSSEVDDLPRATPKTQGQVRLTE